MRDKLVTTFTRSSAPIGRRAIMPHCSSNSSTLPAIRLDRCSHSAVPPLPQRLARGITGAIPTPAIGELTPWLVYIQDVKAAVGTAIDGYVDNVNFTLSAVPEPGVAGLF